MIIIIMTHFLLLINMGVPERSYVPRCENNSIYNNNNNHNNNNNNIGDDQKIHLNLNIISICCTNSDLQTVMVITIITIITTIIIITTRITIITATISTIARTTITLITMMWGVVAHW